MIKPMLALFLLPIFVWSATDAKIRQHIEFDTTQIPRRSFDMAWPFVGSFDFESLPRPLEPTRVDFTLECTMKGDHDYNLFNERDWIIKIFYFNNAVRILSDTVFSWPGPHKMGDRYSNYIEFIPLVSCQFGGISLEIPGTGKRVSFHWCLNEDGELLRLEQGEWADHPCQSCIGTTFFSRDSISFYQIPSDRTSGIFQYEISIQPTPKIGDTSVIIYRLTANRDINDACEMAFGINSMNITEIPKTIDYSLMKGQSVDIEMEFVPRAVSNEHSIGLTTYDCDIPGQQRLDRQFIFVGFIFDENGNLRYAYDHNSGFPQHLFPMERYPKEDWRENTRVIVVKPRK